VRRMPPDRDTGRAPTAGASVLWRRRWIVIAAALCVSLVALGISFLQTPVYTAEATVLVDLPQETSIPVAPDMGTEKKIVDSASVADLVLQGDRLTPTVQQLLDGLSVEVPVDTSVLDISYTDAVPSIASSRAQGFADAYLEFRRGQLLASSQATRTSLASEIASVTGQLEKVQKRADAAATSQERVILTTRASTLLTELTQLEQRMQALPTPDSIAAGEVIQPAVTPTSPSSPNRPLDLVLGLFLGLILGIGIALLRDRADDRLRNTDDLAEALGARVIGAAPPPKRVRRGAPWPPLFSPHPDEGMMEAFRSFRSEFLLAASGRGVKTVLITSCRPEEGKTQTLAYLAEVLASSGKRVVMVSADLRSPRLDAVFEQGGGPGLADVLSGHTHIADARQDVSPCLRLVPSGALPADPAQLLSGGELPEAIDALAKEAEFVLLDSPPILSVPDTRVMLPACDAVIVVADARSTTRSELAEARNLLEWFRAELLGAVLLNADVDRSRSYPPNPGSTQETVGDLAPVTELNRPSAVGNLRRVPHARRRPPGLPSHP
jgi:succinoglycan biosynthesis transport protein ExoP